MNCCLPPSWQTAMYFWKVFPGVAKTLTAKLIARIIDVDFSRIQFTPDLMPSDILGTSVFNLKTSEFEFKSGPIFTNIVLIDEINRAPAKNSGCAFRGDGGATSIH